jgi:signal transduction histidine kinase
MDLLSQEITIIFIASAFFLIVAIGIVVLFLVYQKKQLQYILEKKELSNRFQKELMKIKNETQEETLSHLSGELHDNIAQLLGSAKMLVGVANRTTQSEVLTQADSALSKALTEVRSLSRSLNTQWLEKFNLIDNLMDEVTRINSSNQLSVVFNHPNQIDLPIEKQIMLFRMVQEAFQNSIKHGNASAILIKANQQEDKLTFTIEDNGKGFNISETKQGVGMININYRAQLLGGSARWTSAEAGTQVLIELPVLKAINEI